MHSSLMVFVWVCNYTPAEALGAVLVAGVVFLIISVNSNKSLVNQLNSKKFKTWNWCWYRSVLSNHWF